MVFILTIYITLVYAILIASFVYGFIKVPHFKLKATKPKTGFSVIVPFRNEEANLPHFLKSVKELAYPKHLFEIILVNDASSDKSAAIINTFIENGLHHVSMTQNTQKSTSPKKEAISKGIKSAQYDWIITTDADCLLPKLWLQCYDAFIQQTNYKLIAAPVNYFDVTSFLDRFQTMDLLSLIGTSIGGFGLGDPFLANGANLAYQKKLFTALSGFEGSTKIASGDDVFFLQKVVKNNSGDVGYLKTIQATVETKAEPNWQNLISQRLRWMAKSTHYTSCFAIVSGIIVALMNLVLLLLIPLTILGHLSLQSFLFVVLTKFIADFILIFKTSRLLQQESVLPAFVVASVLYPVFSIFIVVLSFFSSYTWKGRTFKK
ncbi:glycosyltransferase [Bizionia sediminis]|uniref:Glycosyltransferase n=1 Tax=Bizionia sediminis TaxID=1737064 RepID=A0ABW5KQL5_9FLAO